MTVDNAPAEHAVDMTGGFRWGSVPSEPRSHRSITTRIAHADPDLGAIAGFAGKFRGTGFNTIFRPQSIGSSPTPLPNPANGPSDNVLQLNLTEETLEFSSPLGSIPNRGFAQGDIFLNGIPYVQKINDVTDPTNPVGIHFEPGVWLSIPVTETPAEAATVVRMASIPHGTTIDAQGTSITVAGGPQIDTVDITPFPIGADPNDPTARLNGVFPSQTATDDHTFRLPQDLTPFIAAGTISQDMLTDPNTVLRDRATSQNITSTTVIQIDTRRPVPPVPPTGPADPLFGGGTANIAFLLGDHAATNPNADAVEMSATFWIETVTEQITVPPMGARQPVTVMGNASAGEPAATFSVSSATDVLAPIQVEVTYSQIQYTQTVFLNFATLSWPHVSVANLVPDDAIVVDVQGQSLLGTYTVVAGDTLSGIARRFYGDADLASVLAAVNAIANPNVIRVGQVVVVPDLSRTHTVVAGDTLSGIAVDAYGDAGRASVLAAVNAIANPNVIRVGQVLVVPDLSVTHTVVAGDTLFGIAKTFYGHGSLFRLIAEVNGLADPNALVAGRVLVVPSV
jgi:nucleoid-associated protein YgaU